MSWTTTTLEYTYWKWNEEEYGYNQILLTISHYRYGYSGVFVELVSVAYIKW
jgi:hypothetical protein